MSDVYVIPSAAVETLRRKAKKLHKEQGMPHHAALDAVARAGGVFPDWHHLINEAKATEPAEEAFKHGLVIGVDIKDAMDPRAAILVHFVEDERLSEFVCNEFDLHPFDEDMSEKDEWRMQLMTETVFFRSLRAAPDSLDEIKKMIFEDFFFAEVYLRLKGKLITHPFDDGSENEAAVM